MNGPYTGDIGQIDFETGPDGRVVGRYTSGGSCAFEPLRPVMEGEFEGKVLVASLTLCQTGVACDEKPYTVLAFYEPESGVLVADLKLEAGCQSSALRGSRLILRPAKPNEAAPVPHARAKFKKDECNAAAVKGQHLMELSDFSGAAFYFDRALSCSPKSRELTFSLGIAEFRRGNITAAITHLERARAQAIANHEKTPYLYYNLGCVYARHNDRKNAFDSLREALKQGFAEPEELESDPDLQAIREDPDFQPLVDRAWELKAQGAREAANKKGDP